jgi:hypothetical protein
VDAISDRQKRSLRLRFEATSSGRENNFIDNIYFPRDILLGAKGPVLDGTLKRREGSQKIPEDRAPSVIRKYTRIGVEGAEFMPN